MSQVIQLYGKSQVDALLLFFYNNCKKCKKSLHSCDNNNNNSIVFLHERKNNNTLHPVTSNEQDSITGVVNGKLWGLTTCGWRSESGRSRRGRVPHLPPLTSLMCCWLYPTSPTATTTTSEWNILHSPASRAVFDI